MKPVNFLVLVLLMSKQWLSAQSQSYSLSLYYAVNESRSELNLTRLDSFLNVIGSGHKEIRLYSYADFLADPAYNLQLSQKRLETVKKHLQLREGKTIVFTESKAYGDTFSKDNQSDLGEPSQRRVDVFVTSQIERKKIGKTPLETQGKTEKVSKKTETPKETSQLQKTISELKTGESLAIEGLSFIPGRHILMKSSIPVLEDLLNILSENTELHIEVQGHICCLSSKEADGMDLDTGEPKLSENRALAVYNYLIKNGIDADRLSYKGYGHRYPKVKVELTPEDEQMNRRVEIKVLEN